MRCFVLVQYNVLDVCLHVLMKSGKFIVDDKQNTNV